MNYLVVLPKAHGCQIKLVSEDTMLDPPFTSWALASGKQILYTLNSMHRDLKGSYLWGSYQKGADYAIGYEDMLAIVTTRIGPSDFERYQLEIAKRPSDAVDVPTDHAQRNYDLSYMLEQMTRFAWILAWGTIKCLAVLALFPFFIRWIKKKGNH